LGDADQCIARDGDMHYSRVAIPDVASLQKTNIHSSLGLITIHSSIITEELDPIR